MRLEFALLISIFGCAWVIGCGEVRKDTRVPEIVEAHVEAIRKTLLRRGGHVNLRKNAETTKSLFCNISNSTQRIMSVRVYADMLLALDFEGMPVCNREWAVCQYGCCVYHCFQIMGKCGVDPNERMNWFFGCLSKYKELCFSVPVVAKLPGERPDEAAQRRNTARLMRDDYEHQISIVRRFWLPRLQDYLPDEAHDEFRSRIESFFEFPTLQELRRAPMFSGEGVRKIVSPVTQSK